MSAENALKKEIMRRALEVFSQRFRVALAASGTTQVDAAKAAGVSPQAVHKWHRGKAFPNSSALVAICELTGASLDWMMMPDPVDVRSVPGGQGMPPDLALQGEIDRQRETIAANLREGDPRLTHNQAMTVAYGVLSGGSTPG